MKIEKEMKEQEQKEMEEMRIREEAWSSINKCDFIIIMTLVIIIAVLFY